MEILKTRIKKSFKRKINGVLRERIDPDYWEPSRPITSLGMEKMPPLDKADSEPKGRYKTRWNALKKDVVFIDFRSEISAFDKYFFHGNLKTTLTQSNKQDVIRAGSKKLKKVLDNNLSSLKLYGKNVVKQNIKLTAAMVGAVSKILGREYSAIKLIEHGLFKTEGYSAVLQHGVIGYSEAWAGSGEFAVVKLVYSVMAAKPCSLIILDEPEVSLHPGAQTRLTQFLLERIKIDKHQIVIGTHSPFIIKGLPSNAVKTLMLSPTSGKVQIQQDTLPNQAFFHLGVAQESQIKILTEDDLASKLVEKCIRIMGQSFAEKFDVGSLPGGAATLLHHYMPAFSRTKRKDVVIILDGDQKPDNSIPDEADLARLEITELKNWVKKVAVEGIPKFPVDGGDGGENPEQLQQAYVDYLNFCRDHVTYLPQDTPEDFLWHVLNLTEQHPEFKEITDIKQRFEAYTRQELGREAYEDLTAADILATQERLIAKVDKKELTILINYLQDYCSRA